MIPRINRAQLETEARAKILWGEPPEQALSFLRVNGFTAEEAKECVDAYLAERRATVRGIGVKKIGMGIFFVAIPVATWIVFLVIGAIYLWIAGVTTALGLWGIWKIIDGIINMIKPDSEKGDLADQDD